MDKTIEKKFFEAFKWGGVVDKCISWMRYTYNLPKMKPNDDNNEEKRLSEEASKANEEWDKFYREVLPKEILEATDAFDDTVIKYLSFASDFSLSGGNRELVKGQFHCSDLFVV